MNTTIKTEKIEKDASAYTKHVVKKNLGDSVLAKLNKVFHKDAIRINKRKFGFKKLFGNPKQKMQRNQTNHYIKIKSKVHPSIYHMAQVDLQCYERMPGETEFRKLFRYYFTLYE